MYSEQEWKEMIKRVCKILSPEDNSSLPHCLMVAVPKKKALFID